MSNTTHDLDLVDRNTAVTLEKEKKETSDPSSDKEDIDDFNWCAASGENGNKETSDPSSDAEDIDVINWWVASGENGNKETADSSSAEEDMDVINWRASSGDSDNKEAEDPSSDEEDIDVINWCAVSGMNGRKKPKDVKLSSDKEEANWLKRLFSLLNISSKEEHGQLNRLYVGLQEELIQCFDLKTDAIKAAIDHLNYNYRNVFRGKIPSEINYNDMNNCVGYLHRFASCHAALVHDEISRVLETPPIEVSSLLSMREQLNVVCLGSGPGNDIVGFLSAVHGHIKVNHLDITVVDKMLGWAHVFNHTVKMLKEKDNIGGKVSLMFKETSKITTSFIAADLVNTITWSKGMEKKLAKADAILLVKVLSNIQEEKKHYTLKNIVQRMKPRALLFFIDCPELPVGIFDTNSSLRTIFQTKVTRFDFDCKEERYSNYNITSCQAAVSVLGLLNPNKELPNFYDETEWPKL